MEFKGRCQVQWADPKSSTPMAEIHATAVEPVVAEEEYINDCLKLFPGHECSKITVHHGLSRVRSLSYTMVTLYHT